MIKEFFKSRFYISFSKDIFYLSNDRRHFLIIFFDNIKIFIDNKNISSIFDGSQLFWLIKYFEKMTLQHLNCEENIFSLLNEKSSLINSNYVILYEKEKPSSEVKELLIECGIFKCIWALCEKKYSFIN